MKRQIKLFSYLFLEVLLFSCSIEETNLPISQENISLNDQECCSLSKAFSHSKVEQDEAYENLFGIFGGTRSGNIIPDCKVITKESLPNLQEVYSNVLPDTLIYIFYSQSQNGYIMVSADNRTDAILCVNEEDDVETLDFRRNPRHLYMLCQIIDGMYHSILNFENVRDSLRNELNQELSSQLLTRAKLEPDTAYSMHDYYFRNDDTPISDWSINSAKSPLLGTKWGQDLPYNICVKDKIPGDSALTGCVPTATAQLVAYWKYPTVLHGITFDWNSITAYSSPVTSYSIEHVGLLMKYIGEDIGANYSPGATSADTDNAYGWLLNNGYSGNGSLSYNTDEVLHSLAENCPVLIKGYATKVTENFLGITYNTYYTDGHSWVIDGYKSLSRQRHFTIIAIDKITGQEHIVRSQYYTEKIVLLHNNWGWHGYLNNWFTAGTFNTGNPSDVITRSSSYPSYQYELTIYPNVKPAVQ